MKNKKILAMLLALVMIIACLCSVSIAEAIDYSKINAASSISVGVSVDDGKVVEPTAKYCGCCHSHNHDSGFGGKVSCFFCKFGWKIKGIFGKKEETTNHQYVITNSSDSTCSREGSVSLKCAICGKGKDIAVKTKPHTPEIFAEVKATCTAPGTKQGEKCKVCGKTLGGFEVIAALGHTEEIIPAVAATCTETGLTEGKKCSRCDEILVAQTKIEALGHNYEAVDGTAVEATCTEAGKKADMKCTRCGDVVTGETIAALGHTEEIIPAVAPTCTETGLTEGKKCSHCGEILVAQTEVKALGHKPVEMEYSAPTFDNEGRNAGTVCERCGATISGCEVIPSIYDGLVDKTSKAIEITTDAYAYSKEYSVDGDYVISTVATDQPKAEQSIKIKVVGSGTLTFDFCFISNKSKDYVEFYHGSEWLDWVRAYDIASWENFSYEIIADDDEVSEITLTYNKNKAANSGLLIKNLKFSSGYKNINIAGSSEKGSISTIIDGAEYNGNVKIEKITENTQVTAYATANEGYKFFGWVDAKGKFVSFDNPYVSTGVNDVNITAVFDNENMAARLNSKLYATLEDAAAAAVSGDTIYLLKTDYTLEKDVTIPAGVTLVLPCRDGDYGYENDGFCPDGTTTNPSAELATCYSVLTIPKNVTLTVNGTLLVNAVTGRMTTSGSIYNISGGYAKIVNNGNIVVNSGAALDCNGRIEGSGFVLANAGASVYETYSCVHWRGGTIALNTLRNDIFPIIETEMNSIKCSLRINSGASLVGNVKVYASNAYHKTKFPQIDNTNGIYRLSKDAYVIRTVNADKEVYNFYGGMTMSNSALTLVGQNVSTDSNPLNAEKAMLYTIDGDMKLNLHSGKYSVEKGFKLLPGFEMNVADGASLTIASDATLAFLSEKYIEIDSRFNGASATKYPADRSAARLNIENGATVNVYGTLVGNVSGNVEMCDGSCGSVEISVMTGTDECEKYTESLARA